MPDANTPVGAAMMMMIKTFSFSHSWLDTGQFRTRGQTGTSALKMTRQYTIALVFPLLTKKGTFEGRMWSLPHRDLQRWNNIPGSRRVAGANTGAVTQICNTTSRFSLCHNTEQSAARCLQPSRVPLSRRPPTRAQICITASLNQLFIRWTRASAGGVKVGQEQVRFLPGRLNLVTSISDGIYSTGTCVVLATDLDVAHRDSNTLSGLLWETEQKTTWCSRWTLSNLVLFVCIYDTL